jgi:hypothetical protein
MYICFFIYLVKNNIVSTSKLFDQKILEAVDIFLKIYRKLTFSKNLTFSNLFYASDQPNNIISFVCTIM